MSRIFDSVSCSEAQTVVAAIPARFLANRWHSVSVTLVPSRMCDYNANTFSKHTYEFTINHSTGDLAMHGGGEVENGSGFDVPPQFSCYLHFDTVLFVFVAGTVDSIPVPTRCHVTMWPINS